MFPWAAGSHRLGTAGSGAVQAGSGAGAAAAALTPRPTFVLDQGDQQVEWHAGRHSAPSGQAGAYPLAAG
eukprot:2815813-Prymnesium_polylepis.1